jgi:hypothetical protein
MRLLTLTASHCNPSPSPAAPTVAGVAGEKWTLFKKTWNCVHNEANDAAAPRDSLPLRDPGVIQYRNLPGMNGSELNRPWVALRPA